MAKKKKNTKKRAGDVSVKSDGPVLFDEGDVTVKPAGSGPSVLVYLHPEQVEIVERVRLMTGLRVVSAGSPSTGGTAMVADRLGGARVSDLRRGMLELHPDLIWLLTLDEVGEDTKALFVQGDLPPIMTMEPIASSIADALVGDVSCLAKFEPLMRRSPMLRVFDDLRGSFGPVRSVNIAFRGQRKHGSLYGRLTDAVDMMEYLCGPAEQVDSAMSGPLGDPSVSLRAMQGHLTVNARFAENCCACLHVSNMGAVWVRGVMILGENGCVRLTDRVLEWWDHEGKIVDSASLSSVMGKRSFAFGEGEIALPEGLIAGAIEELLDPGAPAAGPRNNERIIAVCEAIRLSLHTGQGETPRKIQALIEAAR